MTTLPKTARGRATRQRIVEAAAELMHTGGVRATSLDEILRRADAGKSQFYHYFEDKDDLIRAVLAQQMKESLRAAVPVLARLDSWSGLREWFDLLMEQEAARGFVGGCPVGSIAAELADSSERLRADLEEAFRIKQRYLLKGLRAMKERGELRDEADPEALSAFALAAIQGGLLLASTARNGAALRSALDHAYDHLRSYGA